MTTSRNGQRWTTHNSNNQLRNSLHIHKLGPQQFLGTPSHPQQAAMGLLYRVDAVYNININQQSPQQFKDFGAIIIDTGAVSVCPTTFAEHIPIKPMAEELKSRQSKGGATTLIIGGLPDLNDTRQSSTLATSPSYIFLDNTCAIALPGSHTPNEKQFDNTVQKRYNPSSTSLIGDIKELNQQPALQDN
eukprot:1639270-Amphidinium_carterae.1